MLTDLFSLTDRFGAKFVIQWSLRMSWPTPRARCYTNGWNICRDHEKDIAKKRRRTLSTFTESVADCGVIPRVRNGLHTGGGRSEYEKHFLHNLSEQELIRRWGSEREHFYNDIAHVLPNTKKRTYFDRLTH